MKFDCTDCEKSIKNGKSEIDLLLPAELKYFKENHMKESEIIRVLGRPTKFEGVREKTFKNLIIRSDYDFLENANAVIILSILLIMNILTNFMFYQRYVYFSEVIDDYTFVEVVTRIRFIVMISVIVTSLLLITIILLYYQSYLASWSVYMLVSEIFSIVSILFKALWISIFLMITFAVMFMIKIDLSNNTMVYRKKKTRFQRFAEKINKMFNRVD